MNLTPQTEIKPLQFLCSHWLGCLTERSLCWLKAPGLSIRWWLDTDPCWGVHWPHRTESSISSTKTQFAGTQEGFTTVTTLLRPSYARWQCFDPGRTHTAYTVTLSYLEAVRARPEFPWYSTRLQCSCRWTRSPPHLAGVLRPSGASSAFCCSSLPSPLRQGIPSPWQPLHQIQPPWNPMLPSWQGGSPTTFCRE